MKPGTGRFGLALLHSGRGEGRGGGGDSARKVSRALLPAPARALRLTTPAPAPARASSAAANSVSWTMRPRFQTGARVSSGRGCKDFEGTNSLSSFFECGASPESQVQGFLCRGSRSFRLFARLDGQQMPRKCAGHPPRRTVPLRGQNRLFGSCAAADRAPTGRTSADSRRCPPKGGRYTGKSRSLCSPCAVEAPSLNGTKGAQAGVPVPQKQKQIPRRPRSRPPSG